MHENSRIRQCFTVVSFDGDATVDDLVIGKVNTFKYQKNRKIEAQCTLFLNYNCIIF